MSSRTETHVLQSRFFLACKGRAADLQNTRYTRSGQDVQFNIREHPHVDYGYAVTSHSSQGAITDRVLVYVDTEQAHDQLVNSRLAYVAVSRGRHDAQIYTNDAQKLGEELSREVSKQSAIETEHEIGGRDQGHATKHAEHQSMSESHDHGQGYGMEH